MVDVQTIEVPMILSPRHRVIGGARIGSTNASWPLASLEYSKDKISLLGYGQYLEFFPGQVDSIDVVYWFPIFAMGIRINHHAHLPKPIIFWCLFPARRRRKILSTGFRPLAGKSS